MAYPRSCSFGRFIISYDYTLNAVKSIYIYCFMERSVICDFQNPQLSQDEILPESTGFSEQKFALLRS